MTELVTVSIAENGVADLLLNRPDKHNALSAEMLDGLTQAAASLGGDPRVRAVVLRGAGKSFCAGGDLGWMQAQRGAGPEARAAEARRLANTLRALNEMPKPLIGAIHGNAFGGALGLASVCDVAIGAEGIKLGFTEVRLGLIPATIGPYVAARMGEARARRVFMSARIFGPAEAVDLGLLARSVPAADLELAIAAETAPYLTVAPGAVAEAKALLRALGPRIDDAVIEHTIAALASRWESTEAGEGIAAFFDRRPPPWA